MTGTNLIGRSAGKELVSDFSLVRASALNLNPVIMGSTARTAQAAGSERTYNVIGLGSLVVVTEPTHNI